ncbi:MAG: flagellar cap protein FliD N-terminal domain-containing protein [Novosphingobium sp.]
MVTIGSSTSSATQSIITALGAGSGIDMAALASNLATAQFAARSDRLQAKSDTLDAQISAATNLKSMVSTLAQSIGTRIRQGDLSPQPQVANGSVARASLSVSAGQTGTYSLEVTELATAQTLASPASTYTAATDLTGSGTLTLRFGTIDAGVFTEDTGHTALAIDIPAGSTLADVAGRINGARAGVTAYVATTTEGARLVIKGSEGAANAFIVEASETASDEGLANLAWTPAGDASRLLA